MSCGHTTVGNVLYCIMYSVSHTIFNNRYAVQYNLVSTSRTLVPFEQQTGCTCSLQRNLWMALLPTVWILLRSSVMTASGRPSVPVHSFRPTSPSPASSRTRKITNRACMCAYDRQDNVKTRR